MKKSIIFITIIVLFLSCNNNKKLNQTITDENGNIDLIGYCNRDAFKIEPFNYWFDGEYETYLPNDSIISEIKKINKEKKYTIYIVMASWCSDSQREVPRFYKILDNIKFGSDKITLINVDHDKKAENTEVAQLNIEKVPTFIFFENDQEIGRIIESPENTLEMDFLSIIK